MMIDGLIDFFLNVFIPENNVRYKRVGTGGSKQLFLSLIGQKYN